MVMGPEFIIADEPISALDVSIRAQVLNLMAKLQRERGLTYLFISHDLSVTRFICDRIAVVHKGVIVELADTEELSEHPLHPYTQALLSAIPMPDPEYERHKVLKIYDPSIHDYTVDTPSFREIVPDILSGLMTKNSKIMSSSSRHNSKGALQYEPAIAPFI